MRSSEWSRLAALPRRVGRYLAARVTIDTRAMAAFRVFAGALIVADMLSRSRNFHFYYTEHGTVTREMAMGSTVDGALSVYFLTTSTTVIAALFALTALVGVVLMLGYKTRLTTILAFVLVISLDFHNPYVISYADILFRLLLFWAIFLPLGERWSIDAVHRDRAPRRGLANPATVVILLQPVTMYVVNGLHKRQSHYWTSGDATPLVMGLDEITFLLGETMRQFPTLLQLGGLAWYYMLLGALLLILLPGRARLVLVAMFMGGHAAFALTVRIGAFPYVAMAGLLLFVQEPFWRYVEEGLSRAGGLAAYERGRDGGRQVADWVPRLQIADGRVTAARRVGYQVAMAVLAVGLVVSAASLAVHAGAMDDEELSAAEAIDEAMEESLFVAEYQELAARAGVNQPTWTIFAPTPRTTDRYYVVAAETETGDLLDVYNDRELTFERPGDELQHQYGTYRERFYMNSVRRGSANSEVRTKYAEQLCDTWRGPDGEGLVRLTIYYIGEDVTMETIDDWEAREVSHQREISSHGCGDHSAESVGELELSR